MHPDTVGGEGVSADYPGVVAKLLGEYRGPDMLTVFANGCCGNINHRDVSWLDPQKGPGEAHRIGTVLAAAVLRTTPHLKPVAVDSLRIKTREQAILIDRLQVRLGHGYLLPGAAAVTPVAKPDGPPLAAAEAADDARGSGDLPSLAGIPRKSTTASGV